MSVKKRTYIPLSGASEGPTVHEKEKLPPKFKYLKNLYPSRDDRVPSLRSDFTNTAAATLRLEAFSDGWTSTGGTITKDDFLAAALYLRNTDTVYVSKLLPYTMAGTVETLRISTYTTGTVGLSTSTVTGSGTEFLQNVWPGCFIKFTDSTKMYLITAVASDTSLTIDGTGTTEVAGKAYTIYQTWHPTAGNYKLSAQPWGNYYLLGMAIPSKAVDKTIIAGPWINRQDIFGRYTWADIGGVGGHGGAHWILSDGAGGYDASNGYSNDDLGTSWATTGGGSSVTISRGTGTWSDGASGNYDEILIDGVTKDIEGYIKSEVVNGSGNVVRYADDFNGGVEIGGTVIVWNALNAYVTDDTSATGVWTKFPSFFIRPPSFARDGFIITSQGVIYTTNPLTGVWSPPDGRIREGYVVALGAGLNFARTGAGRLYFSSEGSSWNEMTNLPFDGACISIMPSGGLLYGVWAEGVASTADGTTWQTYDTDELIAVIGSLSGCFAGETDAGDLVVITRNSTYQGTPVAPDLTPSLQNFEPISTNYRSKAYASVDAYVVLCNVSEWNVDPSDATNVGWVNYFRRVRWPSPGTTNDWDGEGAGFLDCPGGSAIIDAAPVGHNVILFEADGLGLLQQLGDLDSPFGYRPLKQNITKVSNALMLDGAVFFVSEGGQLWTCNGVQITQVPGFDLTEFEDWDSDDGPVWLDYFETYGCLTIFRPKVAGSEHCVYLVGEGGGQVTRLILPEWTGSDSVVKVPKAVFTSRVAGVERLWVSYNVDTTGDADHTPSIYLNTEQAITGVDTIRSGVTERWHAMIQTGELRVVPEGNTTRVHEVELRTHSAGATGSYQPDVTIRAKNVEDTAWVSAGDGYGTIAIDTDSCDGTGTVFSNTVGVSTGSETVWSTQQPAARCRFYKLSGSTYTGLTLTTDYTITGTSQITLTAALTAGVKLVAFWDSCPPVKVAANDYILAETADSMHKVTSVTDYDTIVLDWYLASGSDTGKHLPAVQMSTGDGYATLGLPFAMDGANVEIRIIPRNNSYAATRAKVYGMTVTHTPLASEERRS